jgi:hypothetical protein
MQIARMEPVDDGPIGGVEDRILDFDRPAAGERTAAIGELLSMNKMPSKLSA